MSVVQGKKRNPPSSQTPDPKTACQPAWSFAHPARIANRGRMAPKIAIIRYTLPDCPGRAARRWASALLGLDGKLPGQYAATAMPDARNVCTDGPYFRYRRST